MYLASRLGLFSATRQFIKSPYFRAGVPFAFNVMFNWVHFGIRVFGFFLLMYRPHLLGS